MAIKESEDIIIPIEYSDGRKYLLKISDFKKEVIPDEIIAINPPLIVEVNLSLVVIPDTKTTNNSFGLLTQISTIIYSFLLKKDCILYFYCDDINEIHRNDMSITPQAYRSKLFSRMFDRVTLRKKDEYINTQIFVEFEENGKDREIYMHLIASSKHSECLELLKETLNSFNK